MMIEWKMYDEETTIKEILPNILNAVHDLRRDKDVRKLAAISVVAVGYGGDMDEDLCDELIDDIDYNYNKVKCRKIEQMMPKLMKMVEGEMVTMVLLYTRSR